LKKKRRKSRADFKPCLLELKKGREPTRVRRKNRGSFRKPSLGATRKEGSTGGKTEQKKNNKKKF